MTATTPRTAWTARRPLPRRTRRALVALGAVLVALTIASLMLGDVVIDPVTVVASLLGLRDGGVAMVVTEWRLPRTLAALAFGAALALSGTVFQSVTRNPLGSPDVIGLTTGAYTGALVAIVSGASGAATAAGAMAGGLLTALVVGALAMRGGMLGYRIVIVGIGISAVLAAANAWMLLRARLEVAISASIWGAGSLNGIGWQQLLPAIVAIVVLAALLMLGSRRLHVVDLGDDVAAGLGERVMRTRVELIVVATALVAVVTAAAGPIAFVALAAPHLARAVVRSGRASLVATAAIGATLLLAADVVGQHALPGARLPAGVVTIVLGGAYLIWLVVRTARRSS